MSWFFKILGKASGNTAEVDDDDQVLVRLNNDPTKAGAVLIYDADGNPITVEETGALSVSLDEMVFSDQVDGSTLNTNKWQTSVSGMTIAVSSGFVVLNSGAATTAGAYAILNSIMSAPLYGDAPLEFAINAKVSIQPQSNCTIELGCGAATGVSAPTDGAFFRWNSVGQFLAVVSNAGVETAVICTLPGGVTDPVVPPASNNSELFVILIAEDHVQFLVNDVLLADVSVPVALAFPVSAGHQALFARVYNAGSSPAQAPVLSIGQATIRQIAISLNRSFRDVIASLGQSAHQSPVTAFGQTANHANSTGPVSATLSNTAAGYATLGGRFQFAAVAGAATDYALFAYQVPAPFKFYCTGIEISSVNTGAVVAISATILDWALGVNASAVSLATAESPPTTWAPRRVPLGLQSFKVGDAVGASPPDLIRQFDPPLVVDANRFVHVILAVPVAAATVSEIVRGDVTLHGYFE